MASALTANLVRPFERREILTHLARDPVSNLFLMDMAERVGSRAAPGELRTELAVARRRDAIAGVAGLRPSVVLDADVQADAIEALLPFLETLGVGLMKSGARAVDELWLRLQRRSPRRALLDRYESAYLVRRDGLRTAPAPPGATLRPACELDLDPLVVAARESLREEGRPDPFAGDARGFRRWVRGRVSHARVVESAGQVVFVGYADVQRPEGWLLQGVYTWPDARGKGHAAAGVSALCLEAFEAGADHVQLAVVEGNLTAERLYERLGFWAFARLRTILFSDA
jgi:RimJ/RimL family protein N-acetyltransferase